jgi:hypothetical protein
VFGLVCRFSCFDGHLYWVAARGILSRTRLCRPRHVGDTSRRRIAAAQCLGTQLPHPGNITACGIGEATEFRRAFPEVHYFRIEPNSRLPFDDKSFAIATANAVEHVGSVANQERFIAEFCRVTPRVFVSVPNRYFPIEHHIELPIAHYQDNLFRAGCRLFRQVRTGAQGTPDLNGAPTALAACRANQGQKCLGRIHGAAAGAVVIESFSRAGLNISARTQKSEAATQQARRLPPSS